MNYWIAYLLVSFLGGGGLIALLIYLRRSKSSRPLLQNLILATLAMFITVLVLELYFKVFFAQSDSITTLADRNWNERYVDGTFNSLGYRDIEWTDKMVADKTKVMVVGDSFVEGTGIEYPEDRFPDQLGQMLGLDYVVFNLGKRGAHTSQEIEAILDYPYSPDILILSYFVNDIEGVAGAVGEEQPPRYQVSPLLLPLVRNSYAFNFVFWRLFRLSQIGKPDYKWEWQLSLHHHPNAWWLHQQDLLTLYEGAKSEGIPFIVIVFPSINRTEDSLFVTERILDLYQEVGVPTLDVAELIKDIPIDERIATPVDPHPDELVHGIVAKALYDMFIEMGLTKDVQAQ